MLLYLTNLTHFPFAAILIFEPYEEIDFFVKKKKKYIYIYIFLLLLPKLTEF